MSANTIILFDRRATNDKYEDPVLTSGPLLKDTFNFSVFVFAGFWYLTYNRLGKKDYGIMKKHLLGFTAGFITQKFYLHFMLRN